jgi:hypothetical protein
MYFTIVPDRVLYARKGGEEVSSGISEGEPIDLVTATVSRCFTVIGYFT